MNETNVTLVGAGPIGLEMAVALRDARIDYVHLDAKQVGYTISWFPRQARFFSSPERIAICGVPLMTPDQSKATREDYLAYLWGIVQQFQLPINTYERVTAIRRHESDGQGRFAVETRHVDGVRAYRCDNVILTIGDMHRPRRLTHPIRGEVPGSKLPHVSSYFDEPYPYAGQKLLIVGGRNSAVEAAIRCHRAGAKVAISYRRSEIDSSVKYWLKPEIDWLIRTGDIKFYPNTVPVEITPTTVTLGAVDGSEPLANTETGNPRVAADFVLSLIGYEMDTSLLEDVGVELTGPNRGPRFNSETMETNVPGIYVAGTAAAGTQLRFKLFIENCHSHVVRILRHLHGTDPRHINPLAYSRLHEHPVAAES